MTLPNTELCKLSARRRDPGPISRGPPLLSSTAVLSAARLPRSTREQLFSSAELDLGLLIDDLLLLARLDQGRPLERAPVDLEALVTDACNDARVSDPDRRVTARVTAPLVVPGDEARLRQVLANLLRNAVVHTAPGTPIEVGLREQGGCVVIEVADHGPGIPASARGRIFERFHRADPERSRDQGGSGLGLSIVAGVVAAHGGRVRVSETAGGGATFRIELPLAGPAAPAAVTPAASAPS